MYVSKVKINGVRGFNGPRAVELDLSRPGDKYAGWTVVAGRNGSGKTTLLRAIAIALSGPKLAYSLMPDATDWISVGAAEARVEVEVVRTATPGVSYGLSWHKDAPDDLHSVTWGPPPLGEGFYLAYGPSRRIAVHAGGAHPRPRGAIARMASLFTDDASLSDGVAWLVDKHTRGLDGSKSAALTKQIVLDLLADGLLPDGYRPTRVSADGLWVAYHGRELPLRQMSDGYGVVVGLVVDMVRHLEDLVGEIPVRHNEGGGAVIDQPGVVLIDEIDAHLHISWQQRIGSWLKDHFPRVQFIVSTHSPYVCQAADSRGLVRLPGPVEGRAPEIVGNELYERIIYGGGDDAVLSALFGVDTPYSERGEQLREELAELEELVVDGRATIIELSRYRQIQQMLTGT